MKAARSAHCDAMVDMGMTGVVRGAAFPSAVGVGFAIAGVASVAVHWFTVAPYLFAVAFTFWCAAVTTGGGVRARGGVVTLIRAGALLVAAGSVAGLFVAQSATPGLMPSGMAGFVLLALMAVTFTRRVVQHADSALFDSAAAVAVDAAVSVMRLGPGWARTLHGPARAAVRDALPTFRAGGLVTFSVVESSAAAFAGVFGDRWESAGPTYRSNVLILTGVALRAAAGVYGVDVSDEVRDGHTFDTLAGVRW